METRLPRHEDMEIARLAQLFRDCTQSYKFLFFRAILAELTEKDCARIAFSEILAEMLISAWWPAVVGRLAIGNAAGNDTLTKLVASMGDVVNEKLGQQEALTLAQKVVKTERARGCLRYVPEALLSPWRTGAQLNPLYKVHDDGIELYTEWREYLKVNVPIVRGWADSAWLAWVQARNPNIPVTLEKLGPPARRTGLTREKAFFLRGMSGMPIVCIYTQQTVFELDLTLDHFLPRSFVGHDRIWNLAPVARTVNSSKGARLPLVGHLDELVMLHHHVITAVLPNARKSESTFLDQYCTDLRLSPERLSDERALREAYAGNVLPMLAIAERMGFPTGWS
ncbi:HNH endonuclease domain-containing protein [Rhizobium ruizarguesonis]